MSSTEAGVDSAPSGRATTFLDVESSEDAVSQVFHPHSISVTSPGRDFHGVMTWLELGPLVMGELDYNVGLELDCPLVSGYHLNMPVKGALWSHAGGNDVYTTPGRAVVYRRDIPARVETVSNTTFDMFALKIDPEALENSMAGLLGHDPGGPVAFGPEIDLTVGLGRQWWELLVEVGRQRASGGLLENPMIARPLSQSLLNGLLLAAEHQFTDQLRDAVRPAVPATIRLAEDYILEHLGDPITVADAAGHVGISTRALQRGFLQHLGMSPTRYLRWRRMQRAHFDLAEADPADTRVADVATRWGFTHLSRFARDYRRAFGTGPADTLRS